MKNLGQTVSIGTNPHHPQYYLLIWTLSIEPYIKLKKQHNSLFGSWNFTAKKSEMDICKTFKLKICKSWRTLQYLCHLFQSENDRIADSNDFSYSKWIDFVHILVSIYQQSSRWRRGGGGRISMGGGSRLLRPPKWLLGRYK